MNNLKTTLMRKIARELSTYFSMTNAERTPSKLDGLLDSIKQTDKILKQLKEEKPQPELPLKP